MIARAAEGSVRDALSILDQAIAHGAGTVTAEQVRAMLGLADRARVVELFEYLMKGDVAAALDDFRAQYDVGADPVAVLTDLAEFNHLVTRLRFVPSAANDASLSRGRARSWRRIRQDAVGPGAVAQLADAAQGHSGGAVVEPPGQRRRNGADPHRPCRRPADAGRGAEVAARRIAGIGWCRARQSGRHRCSRDNGANPVPQSRMVTTASGGGQTMRLVEPAEKPVEFTAPPEPVAEAPAVAVRSLEDIAALADTHRDKLFKVSLKQYVRLVRIEPGRLDVSLTGDAPKTLLGDLTTRLKSWTGRQWIVSLSREEGGQTLAEAETAKRDNAILDARSDPAVAAILSRFPGAKVIDVRIPNASEIAIR